ncbi:MAG: hypothetical protein ACK4RM_08000, partial [Flavobacterium sp.]
NGTREKYIGLKRWFDSNGDIKDQYRELLPTNSKSPKIARKTKTKKRTEPEKTDQPVWLEYVLDMLKMEDRPMLVKTMTERAMKRFNIDRKLYEKTRLAVARSMTHLDKKYNKVNRHLVNGKNPGYYGLTEWFNGNGGLRAEYEKKITTAPNTGYM